MSGFVVALGIVAFVALFLDMSLLRLIADRHRRTVPQHAWTSAQVSRLRWGFLGANIYIPFSDAYYLLRVRPRLDAVSDVPRDSAG